jgi:hypothetical protein
MIGFIGTSLQIQQIITVHNQWLLTNRSVPYWTTSVFSSAVTNVEWRNHCSHIELSYVLSYESSRVGSYVTTDDPSASLSWNKAPIWGLRPDFYCCQTVVGLLIWGALFDERTGLSFTISAGSQQRSHSWVRFPRDSWSYFTVSNSRFSFSSPPTTRRATVDVVDPASTQVPLLLMNYKSKSKTNSYYGRWSGGQSLSE